VKKMKSKKGQNDTPPGPPAQVGQIYICQIGVLLKNYNNS
jgi:hypothetical protein